MKNQRRDEQNLIDIKKYFVLFSEIYNFIILEFISFVY